MVFPSLVPLAEAQVNATTFGNAINPIITNIVYPAIELMFAVAILVFAYGIVEMIIHGEDAEARSQGRRSMLGGLIGIFIMVSAWGIVYMISQTVSSVK
jgi:uncharacterized membrane protein